MDGCFSTNLRYSSKSIFPSPSVSASCRHTKADQVTPVHPQVRQRKEAAESPRDAQTLKVASTRASTWSWFKLHASPTNRHNVCEAVNRSRIPRARHNKPAAPKLRTQYLMWFSTRLACSICRENPGQFRLLPRAHTAANDNGSRLTLSSSSLLMNPSLSKS